MPVSVVVADDHPVVRAGLAAWFSGADIEVVGQASNGEEAFRIVAELRPSVLVVEVTLPNSDGLHCLTKLQASDLDVPALVYSAHDNPTYAARASALGAAGYLLKSASRDEFIEAVGAVAAGRTSWPASLVRRLSASLATPNDHEDTSLPLTARERDVLKQIALGLNNREIALALGISYETVKEHVQHILRKLAVADRTQAAIWAVRRGLA